MTTQSTALTLFFWLLFNTIFIIFAVKWRNERSELAQNILYQDREIGAWLWKVEDQCDKELRENDGILQSAWCIETLKSAQLEKSPRESHISAAVI